MRKTITLLACNAFWVENEKECGRNEITSPRQSKISMFTFLAIDYPINLVDREDNFFGIPENVETLVLGTQFTAIIIAVLTQADLLTSLEQMNAGYDCICKEFGEASRYNWWITTACQFVKKFGLSVTFYFIIVIVGNVFDLLLNFTAVEFITQLDDVAFLLASKGYFGSKIREKNVKRSAKQLILRQETERNEEKASTYFCLVNYVTGQKVIW
jgi:hypothetical protein